MPVEASSNFSCVLSSLGFSGAMVSERVCFDDFFSHHDRRLGSKISKAIIRNAQSYS